METLAEYGSDALRLGLIASRSAGQDQAFSTSKVIAGRNFCNKLWNMARFIEDKLGAEYSIVVPKPVTDADHWVVRELLAAVKTVEQHVEHYRFSEAAEVVYHSIWSSLADWYIESSKQSLNSDVLAWALDTALRIAHPFAPFVTETIWQTLPWYADDTLLIRAQWPRTINFSEDAAKRFDSTKALIAEVRFVLSELPTNEKQALLYRAGDELVEKNIAFIQQMTQLKAIQPTEEPRGLQVAVVDRDIWLDIDAKVLDEHAGNLEIRLSQAHTKRQALQARLDTPSYVEKAPAHLVEETKRELAEKKALVERLERELEIIR